MNRIINLPNILQTIKQTISEGYPIICGINCYQNITLAVNGVIPLPDKNKVMGGHTILLVGYDDDKKLFKFRNSWGILWGDKGYGYLPYDYYLNGNMMDLWVIFTDEIYGSDMGIIITNPKFSSNILENEINDIMDQIKYNYQDLQNINKNNILFGKLKNKYNTNPKLISFINNLNMSLQAIIK